MLAQRVSVIAKPLADKKLTKKLYKVRLLPPAARLTVRLCVPALSTHDAARRRLSICQGVKKAHKAKALSRGVKEVVKALKKKKSGCVSGRPPAAADVCPRPSPHVAPFPSTPGCASLPATSRPLTSSRTSPSCART